MKNTVKWQGLCCKSKTFLKHNSPTILTFLGALGVVGTAAMAINATPKAIQRLQQAKDEKGEELTKLEVVNVAAPVYIPMVVMATSTIICIFGANVLNKKHQASLTSAYALLEESYRNYREAAKSVYGEDADRKIIAEMAKKSYLSADGWALYDPDKDNSEQELFYDLYSQRYFNATMPAVINAQYHVNRNLQLRGFVSMNEYYDFLGIDGIENGDDIGWGLDWLMEGGYLWLDFDNIHTDLEGGMECYVISTTFTPSLLYEE